MSTIVIEDLESIRFSAPDLLRMRSFLLDFGLLEAADAGDGVLRMRGSGDAPYIHETVEGDPGFLSVTLRAKSKGDLEMLAQTEGATVEAATGPGGGWMVRLTDPNGFDVNIIADKARAEKHPPIENLWNTFGGRDRPGMAKRLPAGPARVARLGHVVLGVGNAQETWEWWQSRFGLVMSDEVRAPDGNLAAAFVRLDRGDNPTDHHTLNFAAIPGKPAAFHHAAFEVADLDDLMVGHEHLKQAGYAHDWGIGRHILGSQVFDYWKDPWGHRVEHWTDGDVFSADTPPNVHDLSILLGQQWGPSAPEDFV